MTWTVRITLALAASLRFGLSSKLHPQPFNPMTQLLDTIHSPLDVKTLTVPQLEILAEEIREELISVL